MDKDVLKQLGLTDSEVDVYLDLVIHGDSLASEIASRSKITRTYVYDALEHLIDKGIISYVLKNNRKIFQARAPDKLIEYVEYKEKLLEKQKQDIKKLVPELKKLQTPKLNKPVVEVLEGPEGLKTALNDIVKEGHEIYAWGGTDESYKYLPEFILKKYIREKAEKKIKTIQLYSEGKLPLEGLFYKNIKIPKEYSAPVTVGTYGKKTVLFIWTDIPVIVLIDSKEVADSFKHHIKFLIEKMKK